MYPYPNMCLIQVEDWHWQSLTRSKSTLSLVPSNALTHEFFKVDPDARSKDKLYSSSCSAIRMSACRCKKLGRIYVGSICSRNVHWISLNIIESLSKIQICVNKLTNCDRSPSQQTDDPMNEAALRVACAPRWVPSADLSARSLKNGLSMDEEVTRRAASTARLQQDYITAYDHEW